MTAATLLLIAIPLLSPADEGTARPEPPGKPMADAVFREAARRAADRSLAGIESPEAWTERRVRLRQELREMLGLLPEPPRGDLRAVTTGGIAFTAIEAADGAGGTDTVTGLAGDDSFAVTGANAFTSSGVAFSAIEAVAGNTGTDSIIATGNFFAVSADITPPFDCMIRKRPPNSSLPKRSAIPPTYSLVSGPM